MPIIKKKFFGHEHDIFFYTTDSLSWKIKCSILDISANCYTLPSSSGFFSKLNYFSPEALMISLFLRYNLSTTDGINECLRNKEYIKREWQKFSSEQSTSSLNLEDFFKEKLKENSSLVDLDVKFSSLIDLMKFFFKDGIFDTDEMNLLYSHAELLGLTSKECDSIINQYRIKSVKTDESESNSNESKANIDGPINFVADLFGDFVKKHFRNVHSIQLRRLLNDPNYKDLHKRFGMEEEDFKDKVIEISKTEEGQKRFSEMLNYDFSKSRYAKYI